MLKGLLVDLSNGGRYRHETEVRVTWQSAGERETRLKTGGEVERPDIAMLRYTTI
jgi:hypothetical protein